MSSLLVSALPLIDTIMPKLPDEDKVGVEFTLARWLPDDHPRRQTYLERVHALISGAMKLQAIKLHKLLPEVPATYEQRKAWILQEQCDKYQLLGYCQLAELHPEKAPESLQTITKIVGTSQLSQRLYKRVALTCLCPDFAKKAQCPETLLQLCLKKLPSDCEVAFDCFSQVSKIHALTCDVVLKAFSTDANNKSTFLDSYLTLLDKQLYPEKKKHARAFTKKLLAIDPQAAIECALKRTQKNIATAQICLVVAKSQLTANPTLAKQLLQKVEEQLLPNGLEASETSLEAAYCYGQLGMKIEKHHALGMSERHIQASLDQEMAIYSARRALMDPQWLEKVDTNLMAYDTTCLQFKTQDFNLMQERMHTRFKIARILHPQYKEKALELLFAVLPQREEQCCTNWHLQTIFKKIHKFEASYDTIRRRIITVYQENSEKLRSYTLASIAEYIQETFPEEAKELYMLSDTKYPRISNKIAIAQLSGEKKNAMLLGLLEKLATQDGDISYDLKEIIAALTG